MNTRIPLYSPGEFDLNEGSLILVDSEGNEVRLPAGPSDILELAANLAKLAHDIGPIGDLAEQAGAEIALDCCDALRQARDNTQGARVQIIQNALMRLRDTGNHQRAAGGFAGIFEIAAMGGLRGLDR
jgi:hypothetical protein